MKGKFLEVAEPYDGSQLTSLRAYLKHELLGDSIIAWTGPCNVTPEHMVDGEDLIAHAKIAGDNMLHFVIELFDSTLFAAVACQRLFAGMVKDEIQKLASNKPLALSLSRSGDDLYAGEKKLSISIATQSPVSSLIHFAVNIVNKGTPVPTLSLEDLGVEPKSLAIELIKKFSAEIETSKEATQKVRWVR